MTAVTRWKYRCSSWLGRVLGVVELHSIRKVLIDRHAYYAKRRRWYSTLVIVTGNRYLQWLGAHTRVLAARDWSRWESEVYRVVYGLHLTTDDEGRLFIPEWPGTALASILESNETSQAEKLDAIRLATHSLRQLHEAVILWPDGKTRLLSHADATVENVILDRDKTTATWFDFDMIHDESMDADWRRADDLRALTYSAAERLHPSTFPELASTIVENYAQPSVLATFAEAVISLQSRANSFHLAQAQIGWSNRQLLEEALLEALGRPS